MLDEEVGMSFNKLNGILNGTEELSDKYEIEGVLTALQQKAKKIEFLKELKKRRNAIIDEQITSEETTIEVLENAIKSCMAKTKDKSLDFPGVGKVGVRSVKGTWTILDEVSLRDHLRTLGKDSEVVEESWKFKKKDLNKVLDELERNNNTSKFVVKEPDKVSLTTSFPKEDNVPKDVVKDVSRAVVQNNDNIVI